MKVYSTFGQFDFGQLAENRRRNWPKSKLIGRNRTDGVCSVSSFSLSFFFFYFVFLLLFTFFLFLLISLFILFLFCFCFRPPKKPELNTKPRTLHPISAGQPSAGQPSAGQPSAGPPKISRFCFPPPDTIFFLLSLSWGSLSWNFGGVFESRNPEMCTFGLLGCRVNGESGARRSMAHKTRHEQQIVPKSSPIGQGFPGQRWFAKVWAHDQQKWSGPKVVRAKSGLGQKWSGQKWSLSKYSYRQSNTRFDRLWPTLANPILAHPFL